MYDKLLDTFKAVAETGSFTKAADILFITHTAIRKQIDQLEKQIGVKLFDRTRQGVTLTSAGQVMYAEALKIIRESEAAVIRVQDAYRDKSSTLKIGTSILYPCHFFLELWDRIRDECPQFQLKIVSFEDNGNRMTGQGKDYDFLIGAYDNKLLEDYSFLQIGNYRFCLAVPRSNELSRKDVLSFNDLSGQPLMIMQRGTSPLNDNIRDDIEANYPDICIVDIDSSYDIHTFNNCVERGCILLSLECWDRVHPDIKSIPLIESYFMPYGIIYSSTPGSIMKEFIRTIQASVNSTS